MDRPRIRETKAALRAAAATRPDFGYRPVEDQQHVFGTQLLVRLQTVHRAERVAGDDREVRLELACAGGLEPSRGGAAAATWIFRGAESRRRRGRDVDIPRRRVAAAPLPRHGYSVDSRFARGCDLQGLPGGVNYRAEGGPTRSIADFTCSLTSNARSSSSCRFLRV